MVVVDEHRRVKTRAVAPCFLYQTYGGGVSTTIKEFDGVRGVKGLALRPPDVWGGKRVQPRFNYVRIARHTYKRPSVAPSCTQRVIPGVDMCHEIVFLVEKSRESVDT